MKEKLRAGSRAPGFCLPDANNSKVCLKDYTGRWIVLYFYPKDNTSGCTKEAIDFSTSVKDFTKMGAIIIGISPDSTTSHFNFINKHNLKIVLLSDTDHKVLKKYGVWQKKKLYGREYYGVVRTTFVIDPKGKVKQVWSRVKVAGHVDTVKDFVGVACKRIK